MKWRILLGLVFLFALSASTAQAMCPTGDLFCQGWTPAQQAQKVRIQTLDAAIAAHAGMLAGCDAACIDNYNNAARGLLGKLAQVNGLPYEKVVLFAISESYDWGLQTANALKRELVQQDWNSHAARGLNDLADKLRVNHPLRIWDDGVYCVEVDYGGAGTCPGLW